jgi:hypothetical protein
MGLRDVAAKRQASRPKGIAAIRAQKQAQQKAARKGGLSALRAQKNMSSKHDFTLDGIRYHDVHVYNGGDVRPWGTVHISNGDMSFKLHNRYGSWMCDVDHDGRMAEPAAVARALGVNLSQLEVAQALTARWYAELKARGIPTPEERIRMREEEARQHRRQGKKNEQE